MTLPVPAGLAGRLAVAAGEGLDVVYLVAVSWGGSVGDRYYSTRDFGAPWETKLLGIPSCPKRTDASALRFDALNDDLVIRLSNAPEGLSGYYDNKVGGAGGRVQDLMTEAPLIGAQVTVAFADMRTPGDIKYDGVYRVDRVDRNTKEVTLYCVDRLLHAGEKLIGSTINASDWPAAPDESYAQIRGPIFGKVEGLPLVPVEVGLFATLAGEIDDQDGIIFLSAGDMSLWPSSGFVEIGDEVVYYPVIDRAAKVIGNAQSRCIRGTGFPYTMAAGHADYALVRELYSGREALLWGGISSTSNVLYVRAPDSLPPSGVLLVDQECIGYASRAGQALQGLGRGFIKPTIAKLHNLGTPVRTFPVGPDGKPRYRYVIGEGHVNWAGNLRVRDEAGNDLPYMGGQAVQSYVTGPTGKLWAVLDLPTRARFERFDESGIPVPAEWIVATNGVVDAEGVATPDSFLRWRPGAGMSPAHLATWPRAIDPSASTRAVIMEATQGSNVFSLQFDADWDTALNDPRRKYGRFRDARLRIRVQYDRQTTTPATYQIHSNGLLVKGGVFQPPTLGGGVGGGNVLGSQRLPETRWGTQRQTRDVRFSSRSTNALANGNAGYWIDPVKVQGSLPGGGRADHSSAYDGDTRSFLAGAWIQDPFGTTFGQTFIKTVSQPGVDLGPLYLYSNDTFPSPASADRLTAVIVTIHNPSGENHNWTGWNGTLYFYGQPNHSGGFVSLPIGIDRTTAKVDLRIPLDGLNVTWANCQSIILAINQYHTIGFTTRGAVVGEVSVAVEFAPDVEGQRVGTIVDGSYFSTTATTTPSAIFDQPVSLGSLVKSLARQYGVDPWHAFSNVVGEALRFSVILPTAGDGLRFAVADVFLELEYDPLSVVYDGQVLADVDGRVGIPVGGGQVQLMEDPTDILAYLVDAPEFYNMAAARDAVSWPAARALTAFISWKMARAITSQIMLRDLVAELVFESRLLLLADGQHLNVKVRFEEAAPADALRTVGDQINPAYATVNDDIDIAARWEDIHNSIGFYYRRNYANDSFRAVLEERDAESVRLYGESRSTVDLNWHQSSRGYPAGLPEQQARLKWLTSYTITVAARLWDYATFELPASAVEDVQRYDVLTLNRPRSGYYATPGRVVATQRLEGPMRWQVTMQMNRSTMGFAYQAPEDPRTYIKLAEAGARMDFVIQGVLVAQITSGGHFRARGAVQFANISVVSGVPFLGGGYEMNLYRVRGDGAFASQLERLFTIDNVGNVTVFAYNNGTTTRIRDVAAPGIILNIGGVAGIYDTGTASATGRSEVYLANRLVMFIDNAGMTLLGGLSANLGMKMGSV